MEGDARVDMKSDPEDKKFTISSERKEASGKLAPDNLNVFDEDDLSIVLLNELKDYEDRSFDNDEFEQAYELVKKIKVLRHNRILVFDLSPIAEGAKGLTLEIYRDKGYVSFLLCRGGKCRGFAISLLLLPPVESEFPQEFEDMLADILYDHFGLDVDGYVFEWLLTRIYVEFENNAGYLLGENYVRRINESYYRMTVERLKRGGDQDGA